MNRVGMISDAPVVHVEIRVHESRFKVGREVVFFLQFGNEPGRVAILQNPGELGYRNLDEIGFAGDERIPARGVLGNEFNFDPIGERQALSLQLLQPQPALAVRVEPFRLQVEDRTPKLFILKQHGAGAVEAVQAVGSRTHRVAFELRTVILDRFPRNDGGKTLRQRVCELRKWRYQLDLDSAFVECA